MEVGSGYTERMSAKEPIDTHRFPLGHEPIEGWQRMDPGTSASAEGSLPHNVPTTAFADLGTIAGAEYGLWEMSAGTMRDIEGDEVFLVISGTGRIAFDEFSQPTIELKPGALVRLEEGMATTWYVDEAPLRKLFIAPGEGFGPDGV